MTALPRNQYSTTFSLDGIGSPASPHRSRHMPNTFKPIPLKNFTVVVSIVPADQLRHNSSAGGGHGVANNSAGAVTQATMGAAAMTSPLDGFGGAAGVGGLPSMASSIPVGGGPCTSSGLLVNASFGPASSSFALTKSFGDVFTLRKAAAGNAHLAAPGSGNATTNFGANTLSSSGQTNSSFDSPGGLGMSTASSSAAAAAAAAAVKGHVDASVSETPVLNSRDTYRVHLLLPANYQKTSTGAQHASPTTRHTSTANATAAAEMEEAEHISAATSSLESLRTAKRQQAAQVNEHWVLFQQLVRFVLSVAPRFEPPPTPPGFAFPVDLGLSFVQNSSIFGATEVTPGGRHLTSPGRAGSFSSSSFGGPSSPIKTATEDPTVRGEEREARRAYMEAYLNAALQCDQVNCLKEVQSFVGYDAYVKNELAHFRAIGRTSSSNSLAYANTTTTTTPASALYSNNSSMHRSGSNANFNATYKSSGSRAEFTRQGPLGSSSQSTSSRSQFTVATSNSSHSHRTDSPPAPPPPSQSQSSSRKSKQKTGSSASSAVAATAETAAAASGEPARSKLGGSLGNSSHPSEESSGQNVGGFSVSPPVLARSLPPSSASAPTVLDDPHSSPLNPTTTTTATTAAAAAAPPPRRGVSMMMYEAQGGMAEVIDYNENKDAAAATPLHAPQPQPHHHHHHQHHRPASSLASDTSQLPFILTSKNASLSQPPQQPQPQSHRGVGNGSFGSAGADGVAARGTASPSVVDSTGNDTGGTSLVSKPLAISPSSSNSHRPSGPLALAGSSGSNNAASLLLGAVVVKDARGKVEGGRAESINSSQSAGSSFGSSVSHPGSTRRRHQKHRHSSRANNAAAEDEGGAELWQRRRHKRSGGTRQRKGDSRNSEEEEEDEEEEEVAAAPLSSATPAATTTTPAAPLSRADLKSLVSIAPETERMLTECFRMMDSTASGYVSAADCLVFYLCATPDTFAQTLHLYTDGSALADTGTAAAASAQARKEREAQLEALMPTWMKECDSVVVGNPDYLVSCVRFVDAVREILAVASAMALSSVAAAAAMTTSNGNTGSADRASNSTRPRSKPQTSAGGDNASRNHTPASSAPSPLTGVPAVLSGSQPSRDGRRQLEGTPLNTPAEVLHDDGVRNASFHSHSVAGSTTFMETECTPHLVHNAVPAASAHFNVASLEAWIDNYWLLMYSHLFTGVASLVVGAEAAELRAALLQVREKAYLEMAAQVAAVVTAGGQTGTPRPPQQPTFTASADQIDSSAELASPPQQQSATPPSALNSPMLQVVCPPWLLQEVATAVAAQPPLLGCFDAMELLSLLYVVCDAGVAVVGLEDVLHWLGTQSALAHLSFTLEEFASLLDVLSCSLPFADVLHCVRRQWSSTPALTSDGTRRYGVAEESGGAVERPARPLAHPTHLLRLVSRCAAADPQSGREFNELLHEQRWRRSGGSGGDPHGGGSGCAQCQLSRGVMEQQATLVETLTRENAELRQRVAELEEAATAAAAAAATTEVVDAAQRSTHADPSLPAAPPAETAAAPFTETMPPQERQDSTALESSHTVTQSQSSPLADGHVCEGAGGTAAAAVEPTATQAESRAAPHRITLELVPVFTNEADAAAAELAAQGHRHHASAQARAAATQVARAGPLLYTVPSKYAQRQPSELEFSFYLCRAAPREHNRPTSMSAAAATTAAAAVGAAGLHLSAPSAAAAAAVLTERLTVRDAAGRRVVAFKVSNTVLYILGRDPAPVATRDRLLADASPPSPKLSPSSSSYAHRHPHSPASPSSPLRHPMSQQERTIVHGVVGREQNILYPNCDDNDWAGGDNPHSLFYRGTTPAMTHRSATRREEAEEATARAHNISPFAIAGVRRTSPVSSPNTRYSSASLQPGAGEEGEESAQRVVSRVELKAHTWYTLQLRMDWQRHAVDVSIDYVTPVATSSPSRRGHRSSAAGAVSPHVTRATAAHPVYSGRVRMLDAAAVATVSSVDVFPRREMLVAYCNMLIRYDADK